MSDSAVIDHGIIIGVYDYRWVPGNWQLAHLKKGKTTQNEKQKNQEKFKSTGMVDQKVFRPDGSKFGLSFELALLLHGFLATFLSKLINLAVRFPRIYVPYRMWGARHHHYSKNFEGDPTVCQGATHICRSQRPTYSKHSINFRSTKLLWNGDLCFHRLIP